MEMIGIYTRVSSEMQADNYSLSEQERRGIAYATSIGEAYIVYSDIKSGSDPRRMDRIKKDILVGKIDCLWVVNLDRLTRLRRKHAVEFLDFIQEKKVRIIEDNHEINPDSLYFDMNIVINRDFIRRLVEKTSMGKMAEKNAGKHTYSSLFGYEPKVVGIRKNGRVIREWKIAPEKAKIVKLIFKLNIKDRLGLAEICKRLNSKGYRSERGENFEPSAVSRILKHIEYAGMALDANKQIIGSKVYQPIIDLETWKAAQDSYIPTITNNNRRGRDANHAMTNILHCSYCGAGYFYHYSSAPYKWKNSSKITIRHRHSYYHRNTVRCEKQQRKTFAMEILDAIGMILYFRAMTYQSASLLNDVLKEIKNTIDDDALRQGQLEKQREEKQKQKAKLVDRMAIDESIENAVIEGIKKREVDIKVIDEEIERIKQKNRTEKVRYELILSEFSLEKVREYILATPKVRLEMLKRILKDAVNEDGELTFSLIDGRVFLFNYEDYKSEFKWINRFAAERVKKIPEAEYWEKIINDLSDTLLQEWAKKRTLISEPLSTDDIDIVPARILHMHSKVGERKYHDWEREYLIASCAYLMAKTDE